VTALALDRTFAPLLARWRPVLGWWAISRLVTLAAFLVLEAIGPRGHFSSVLYSGPLGLLEAWDGVWYARVAQHGYLLIPGFQSNPAFFPLFPIVLRTLHATLGLSSRAGGVLVANLAFVAAVVAFYELGLRVLGDAERARRAACMLAVAPMGFVFSMVYPESLSLLLVVAALLAALRDRFLLAAGLAAAAVLASAQGSILVVPLLAIAWSRWHELDPTTRGRALAASLAGPAALVSYPLYLQWSLHDANAWGQAEQRWGRSFSPIGPWRALEGLSRAGPDTPVLVRDTLFLLVYAALLVVAARRAAVPAPWIVAAALLLAVPLFSGSFESEGRFGLLALPVYWGAAALVRSQAAQRVWQLGSLALLVAGVIALPYLWP
jgi:mannosyltransferase PIG-V